MMIIITILISKGVTNKQIQNNWDNLIENNKIVS